MAFCCSPIDPVDWFSAFPLSLPSDAPVDPINVDGPCECGRIRGDVVFCDRLSLESNVKTVTPPDVIFVDGMPHLLWPVMITLLLRGGTGVT